MSLTSKLTFGASCVFTVSIIAYVHIKQNIDRERLHEGVIRDVETQRRRRIENVLRLEKQSDLTKHLERLQESKSDENVAKS